MPKQRVLNIEKEIEDGELNYLRSHPDTGFAVCCAWMVDPLSVSFMAAVNTETLTPNDISRLPISGSVSFFGSGYRVTLNAERLVLFIPDVLELNGKDCTFATVLEQTRLWMRYLVHRPEIKPFLPADMAIVESPPPFRLLSENSKLVKPFDYGDTA
jgi:hypothetical protein